MYTIRALIGWSEPLGCPVGVPTPPCATNYPRISLAVRELESVSLPEAGRAISGVGSPKRIEKLLGGQTNLADDRGQSAALDRAVQRDHRHSAIIGTVVPGTWNEVTSGVAVMCRRGSATSSR